MNEVTSKNEADFCSDPVTPQVGNHWWYNSILTNMSNITENPNKIQGFFFLADEQLKQG